MTPLCRRTSRAFVVVLFAVSTSCARSEEPEASSSIAVGAGDERLSAAENPFTRTSVEKSQPASDPCVTASLDTRNRPLPTKTTISNRCEHPVAVVTSPLEVRLRRTGEEKFVHERMSWTAYALLYVVAADRPGDPFRGDGVIRDGGLRVRRPPAYLTVGPKATVTVPIECDIDLPDGRYALVLMTYEALQRDSPEGNGTFDCAVSVEAFNDGAEEAAQVYLSREVREVQSGSITVEVENGPPGG